MIGAVVDRLRALGALAHAAGTAELATIVDAPPRHLLPGAWVHPLADTAGTNATMNLVRQRLERQIGVLLGIAGRADQRLADTPDLVEGVVDQVRAALLGWSPASPAGPLELVGGRLLAVGGGVVWWREVYRTFAIVEETN